MPHFYRCDGCSIELTPEEFTESTNSAVNFSKASPEVAAVLGWGNPGAVFERFCEICDPTAHSYWHEKAKLQKQIWKKFNAAVDTHRKDFFRKLKQVSGRAGRVEPDDKADVG